MEETIRKNMKRIGRIPGRLYEHVKASVDFYRSCYDLCLPLRTHEGGGVYSFIRNFRTYLDQNVYAYTDDYRHRYRTMLVCAWTTDHRHILQARKRNPGLKIVHRVDNAGREYGRSGNCDERLANINKLVDVTIFQSRYSRYVTMEKYKLVKKDGPIIYNPIDTDLFNPDGPKASLPPGVKICNASWSTNPMKGTGQIPSLAEKNPDFHFILCGRYDSMPELPNIHFLGQLCKEELAKVMRSSDVFFFPSRNEACPNVVIEALASGLPIVYHDSGATKELVGDCGLPVEEGSFRSAVHTIVDRKREYSEEARERAIRMFGLEIVCRNYLDVIEGMLA